MGPFVNLYALSAFAVTVARGKKGGLLRRGVYLRRHAAFAAMDESLFNSTDELAGFLREEMPEAVMEAGQKYFRLLDVKTYTLDGWRRRLRANLQSDRLLRALRDAQNDLQVCEALLLAGEALPLPKRHTLEEFAGKVYFSVAP